MFSSEEPDRLRGPQHGAALCDELASWKNPQDTWDMLMFGLRMGKHPQCVITTTPRPIKILKGLIKREGQDVAVTRGKTSDNRDNLAPTFVSTIIARYAGTRLARQELQGEILEDIEGALWSSDLIEVSRVPKGLEPDMRRVVISIDPTVSVSETSDLTGIMVVGLGVDGHGYVLEDLSGRYSPTEWAQKAIATYKRHQADRIVAEANQSGAMVEATLRAVDRNVPVRLVHASRNKITRAEPISALYEQHRVHHVGGFAELEDEMCSYEPGTVASPDRLDALVWGLSDLMIGFEQSINFHEPFVSFTPRNDTQCGLPVVLAPAFYGSTDKPGGWPAGHDAFNGQFSWSALKGSRK
jgi:predicted phage terminase large subunit-like protein